MGDKMSARGTKGIHSDSSLCLIHDMFHRSLPTRIVGAGDLSQLLDQLARCCTRPRYAFMLLTLLADVAKPNGSAGPLVRVGDALVPLRDWLCDSLTPMGHRDPRRIALMEKVREEIAQAGGLTGDRIHDDLKIREEVHARVRASGKSNLSRAASELVKAGLLKRHYQGYRVDHLNRGAQRQAVYTLAGQARALLQVVHPTLPTKSSDIQGDLFT